jgi:hypothetical protein
MKTLDNKGSTPEQPGPSDEGRVVTRYTVEYECTTANGKKKCDITNVTVHRIKGLASPGNQPPAPARADAEQVPPQKEVPEEAAKTEVCEPCDMLEEMAKDFADTPAPKEETEKVGRSTVGDNRQGAGALGRRQASPRKSPLGGRFRRVPRTEHQEETG